MDPLLNIPPKYIFPYPVKDSREKFYVVAANIDWIRELVSTKQIPENFPIHETQTDDNVAAFLCQGTCSPLGPNWRFILLTVLDLSKRTEQFKQIHIPDTIPTTSRLNLSQAQEFIAEASFNFIWEQPRINFLPENSSTTQDTLYNNPHNHSCQRLVQTSESSYFSKIIAHLYPSESSEDSTNNSRPPVSNLNLPLTILKLDENEESDKFILVHSFIPHTLRDAITFSPSKLMNSTAKQLFLCYQILHFIRDMRKLNVPLGDTLTLAHFRTDESLYLSVAPSIVDLLKMLKMPVDLQCAEITRLKIDPDVENALKYALCKAKGVKYTGVEFTMEPKHVEKVIRHWCQGLLSNYDYLLFLNFLAGRHCNGNPNYHPVFPWVSNFSEPFGGWRELTKSKFRLNKGDRQLDLMYDEGGAGVNTVPHHVTDILSEITYYVYKARRTPKEVLKKFVRPNWVPAEYPVSIQRMQEWTPDECIPEFYDDPLLFKSIHEDLPDLQVPKWATDPENFIKAHRKLLESEFVSAKLHHWIDLTFGYKLSGNAAVKSKNMYLSLVDSHQSLESHGMVQLFQTPHPPRRSPLRDLKNTVHYKELKKMRDADTTTTTPTNEDPVSKEPSKITLPKHYDPMGFLNDLEVSINFFTMHFPYLKKDPQIILDGIKNPINAPKITSTPCAKLFGCLLLELVMSSKLKHVSTAVPNVDSLFNFYKEMLRTNLHIVPLFCKRALQAIFLPETLEFSIPLEISVELLLLGEKLGPLAFPRYFDDLLKMVRTMRRYDRVLELAAPSDTMLKNKVQELKVKSFSRDFLHVLETMDENGVALVEPFLLELFNNVETRVLAVWNLFCPFARVIGRKRTVEVLLTPLTQIYESQCYTDKHLKLFHRTFLLQLCSCFGMEVFLKNFSTLLIEAIGGWKGSKICSHESRTNLNSSDIIELSHCGSKKGGKLNAQQQQIRITRSESEVSNPVEDSSGVAEPEMFLMEPDFSDSEGNDNSSSHSVGSTNILSSPGKKSVQSGVSEVNAETCSIVSSNSGCQTQGTTEDGDDKKRDFNVRCASDISEMCCESVIWLAHRLGPVLTAKYLTKNLLRMLTLCYLGHLDSICCINVISGIDKGTNRLVCDGDAHAQKVLECLMSISDLYGDSFLEGQYLPYALELIAAARTKMSITAEAALLGISTLLERIFQEISDPVLMAQLKEPIVRSILSPLINMVCADDMYFPSGANPRLLLATKTLRMMNAIRTKIGPDLSLLNLKPIVLVICSTFQAVYSGKAKEGMEQVFGPLLAHQTVSKFCDVIAGTEHETLLRDLCLKLEVNEPGGASDGIHGNLDNPDGWDKSNLKKKGEQHSSFGSRSFGNRIQIHEGESYTSSTDKNQPISRKDTSRHLKGNWVVYWEHEIGRSDSRFNFKQIKLQTFTGHIGAVRCIYSLDNENSFLTASKDKTVKLFCLRNQGDENVSANCQWTYTHHKKAVLSVLFQEPLHIAASTDGIIHIWDPFVGKMLRILEKDSSKNGQVCCLRSVPNSQQFLGVGIDSTIHVVDSRTSQAYELKIGISQPSGLIRCMSISDSGNIVSVGHSSGMLSSLDLRSGSLMGSWKAHEGEVLQLICYQNKYLISSSFDQAISIWNLDDNKLAFNLKGTTEPVHSLWMHDTQLISCTTSNRIGVHSKIDPHSDFSSTRLRSDAFKGIVTSMRLLPQNQMLLLGSDSGLVSLLC